MIKHRSRIPPIAVCLAVLAEMGGLQAQTVTAPGQTVPVVPGPEYKAGSLKEKLLGKGWRELWLTPVDAPVFDIGTYAGGLKVLEMGGGRQTLSLHMVEKDGWREYQFRSVDKFPVRQAMPPALRGTPVGYVIQDQVSTLFPAGALMIPPLLESIGVLHVKPELYVMPDDPRLGIYQDTFATLLGTVELSPQEAPENKPGFAGSTEIKNTDAFLEDIRASRAHRLDERELMALRLVDFMVNDNDRTADNMRFARYGQDGAFTWRPLPRDRDRAFTDAGGWLIRFLIRPVYPKMVEFGPSYSLAGLTFDTYQLDRRLLQRLTRSDVDGIAQRVQRAIDNQVIEQSIAALPPRWRAQTSVPARLRTVLRARRDGLPGIAREFYEWLATEVDVHGTDEDEQVTVERHGDGRVTVTVAGLKDSAGVAPFSHRIFMPGETNEVRLYLHGGNDAAVVRGGPEDDIIVRIIGGPGNDTMADSAGGGATRFYDSEGENRFVTAKETRVSFQHWVPPRSGAGVRLDAPWRPDWGGSKGWGPTFDFVHGGGLVVGFGPRYKTYGFRRLPHRLNAGANLLVGLGNGRPGISMNVDYRAENSPLALTLDARATRFEAFQFHGFGNDTPLPARDLAMVNQDNISVEPRLVWQIGWRSREGHGGGLSEDQKTLPGLRPLVGKLTAGPVLYWNDADPANGSPFADESAQGREAIGRVGIQLGLDLDRTAGEPVTDRGWTARAELAGYPPVWDLEESFNTASAVGTAYLPLPGDGTHLAFRAGGAIASGAFPLQHAPSIGGRQTVRGYRWQRYSGESTTFGSAEVRVPLGIVPLLIKWNAGAFGLADAGRVWFEGRSPGGWHTGFGGGLWFAALGQTFSLAYVHGEENRIYLQRGMSF